MKFQRPVLRGCSPLFSRRGVELAQRGLVMGDASHPAEPPELKSASILGSIEIPEEQLGAIREKQIDAVGSLLPVIGLANLINAAVVMISFANTPANRLLGVWSMTMVIATSIMLVGYFIMRRRSKDAETLPSAEAGKNSIDRFARFASVLGILWGILPLLILPLTDHTNQLAVSSIVAGVMFAGVLLIGRIPEAAMGFLIPTVIGYVVGLQLGQDPRNDFLSVLAFVYAVVLWTSSKWSFNQFVEQHLNGSAVKQQAQLIGLLLRDFEESTSDWLWQTDQGNLLIDIPLPTVSEQNNFELMAVGVGLTTLFKESDASRTLSRCLERQQSFRDLNLEVEGESQTWWSLTGKPIFDSVGKFQGFRGVASDITQSKAIEDRIAFMAHFDPLTSLPNRANLHECLEKAAARPIPDGRCRALLWLDLDNFKWVNDTLGHPAGDELLCQVANRLKDAAPDAHVIARLGGDEFAMLLECNSQDELIETVKSMSERLNRPYDIWSSIVHCGASIGVRIIEQYNMEIQTLLKHADLALYQAKEAGKRTWCVFSQNLEDRAKARQTIELDLNKALENNELRLFFQPQLDAKTNKIIGAETLIRWQHPTRGLIGPDHFIQHAED
ncbi:MAG TPA: GGDEF and EAL domain-containing protein, partial [Henriciella marina]|nr:GGDEF and EAL domain-containing protein [Henriciella marina]